MQGLPLKRFGAPLIGQNKFNPKTYYLTMNLKTTFAIVATMLLALTAVAQTDRSSAPLVTDSLKFVATKHGDHLVLELSLEYPVSGPEKMVRTLTDSILSEICFARSFCVDTIYEDEIARTWDELPVMLWESLNDDWDTDVARGSIEEDDLRPYELSAATSCLASTPRFATFECTTSIFPYGAAHPMPSYSLYTVDAATGHLLTPDDIFRVTNSEELWKLICQELYSQELYKQFESDAAFIDFHREWSQGVYSSYTEALPCCQGVGLVPEGVRLQYQAYELGPYSMGAPSCVLPLGKVRHLLTPYALRLLGK